MRERGQYDIGRRKFLTLAGAGAARALMLRPDAAEGAAERDEPNIIVILADDLGYGDVGCYGCRDIPTPHIDSIARNGVRFTSGYVSAPMCSPMRAGLLTGRYQQRFGYEFNIESHFWMPEKVEKVGLPLDETTIADMLKKAGYTTGLVGKWHLGLESHFHPNQRGFDEFYGCLNWGYPYVVATEPDRPTRIVWEVRPSYEGHKQLFRKVLSPILRNTTPVEEEGYFTDALTREALDFIDRHRNDRFFLYLSYTAVHTPLEATQKYLDRFPDIGDKDRRTYAAMTSALDDGVGAVLEKLRETGLEKDTLLIFLSDNGGLTLSTGRTKPFSNNAPLKGGKLFVYEGGVRVPFLAQWPGRIPPSKVYPHPVISLDVASTVVAVGGGELPNDRAIDGVNLIPYLVGEKRTPPHEVLCWRVGPNYAVRKGNWKLVRFYRNPIELYDLEKDIGENHNLAPQEPDVVEELHEAFAEWQTGMAQPAWPTLRNTINVKLDGRRIELYI